MEYLFEIIEPTNSSNHRRTKPLEVLKGQGEKRAANKRQTKVLQMDTRRWKCYVFWILKGTVNG